MSSYFGRVGQIPALPAAGTSHVEHPCETCQAVMPLLPRLKSKGPGVATRPLFVPTRTRVDAVFGSKSYLMAPFMPFGKKLFADAVAPR